MKLQTEKISVMLEVEISYITKQFRRNALHGLRTSQFRLDYQWSNGEGLAVKKFKVLPPPKEEDMFLYLNKRTGELLERSRMGMCSLTYELIGMI